MNLYRKKLLEAYFLMESTQLVFFQIAFDICLLDELKGVKEYMDYQTDFPRDILGTMKDPFAQQVNQFIIETDPCLDILDNNNHFLDEELDELGPLRMPVSNIELTRQQYMLMLFLYFRDHVSELTKIIHELCHLSGLPPITDLTTTTNYEDEDIQALITFYIKGLELIRYIFENNPGE